MNGINSEFLVQEINRSGTNNAYYISEIEDLFKHVKKNVNAGDIILTSGAGNVWKHGEELLRELQ